HIGDLFSNINGNDQIAQSNNFMSTTIPKPASYSGKLQPFHRNDCLVMDKGWIGHLQNVDTADGTAVFHPLQLPAIQ
ncbi:hypothetical protein, partial [Citrobacter koseri]